MQLSEAVDKNLHWVMWNSTWDFW